jgi:creatinine amidohydrolase
MSLDFAERTSPEIGQAAERNTLVLIPVGQIEEHGRHLPLNTDVVIADRIARGAAERIAGEVPVLVTPAVWAGYSAKEMARWPGTIRLSLQTVTDTVFGIARSLVEMGFRKLAVINGHGHHSDVVRTAARMLADETGVHMLVAEVAGLAAEAARQHLKAPPGGSAHGGEFETSLMLHFGARVEMGEATADDAVRHSVETMSRDNFKGTRRGAWWSMWALQRSETGILGDPTAANAETGRLIAEAAVANLAEILSDYWKS